MLPYKLLLILCLLFAVFMLVMLGQRLRISYPILLVIAGLLIGIVPGIPHVGINPEFIFLLILPPLLYEAAWYTSWYDFWKWKRPIALLAFGLVIFTSAAVAFVSSAMIPGFTLALGFLLGGIVSPPDAVAATSVLKGMAIPRRVLTILEGESLVNDASSLIVFRFALAAVVSGQFVLRVAVVDFFLVAGMGVVIGLAIAHIMYVIHRWMPTTPSIDTALTLMTPYLMYIVAEQFHYSGVMAVVSGGLFLSFRSHEILSYRSRIQATGTWSTVVFVLNGLVFILIGLELPTIVAGLGDYSMMQAITYGVLISLLTIVIRIVWVYPAAYIPRILSKRIRERESSPGWKGVFLVSWSGMRGVVSLASALSVPFVAADGAAFPQRNLILFITFVVILFTLVLQGLSLPILIRVLGIREVDERMDEEEQDAAIRLRMTEASLSHLNARFSAELHENDLVRSLRTQYEQDIRMIAQHLDQLECDEHERDLMNRYREVVAELIGIQRKELVALRKERRFDDEVLRKHEMHLDIEAVRIAD